MTVKSPYEFLSFSFFRNVRACGRSIFRLAFPLRILLPVLSAAFGLRNAIAQKLCCGQSIFRLVFSFGFYPRSFRRFQFTKCRSAKNCAAAFHRCSAYFIYFVFSIKRQLSPLRLRRLPPPPQRPTPNRECRFLFRRRYREQVAYPRPAAALRKRLAA